MEPHLTEPQISGYPDARVSYRRGEGEPWKFPSPPEILKFTMVIIVLSQVLNNNLVPDFIRSNLRGYKFKIFLGGGGGGGGGGGHAPRPPW